MAKILRKRVFAGGHFEFQNGRHRLMGKNANIGFLNRYTLPIPKMYRSANLQESLAKLHKEMDYMFTIGSKCRLSLATQWRWFKLAMFPIGSTRP